MQASLKRRIDKLHARVVIDKPEDDPEEVKKKATELMADIRNTFKVIFQQNQSKPPAEQERQLREPWNELVRRFRHKNSFMDRLSDVAEHEGGAEDAMRYWRKFLNQSNEEIEQ